MIDWSDLAIFAGLVLVAVALWLSFGWASVLAFVGTVFIVAGLVKEFYSVG